jgi:PAS domain S-box-containing protein
MLLNRISTGLPPGTYRSHPCCSRLYCTATLVFLSLFAARPLAALDPNKALGEYIIKTWAEEDGLPHRLVLALCETRDGYIWLGTQGGLARFDGMRFTVFNSVNTPEIVENSMRALVETPDGTLWIATLRSDLLRVKAGRFERMIGWLPEAWTRVGVRDLFVDSKGVLWFTTGDGVGRLGENGQPRILSPAEMPTDLNYVRRRIVEDNTGRFWISASDGVRSVQGDIVSGPLPLGSTRGLYVSNDNSLWLGLDGRGINRLRPGDSKLIPFPVHVASANLRITVIRSDRQGNVWVGTTSGLYRIQPQRIDAAEVLLGEAEVEDLMEDSHDNLWVATRSGLVQIKDPPFRSQAAGKGLQEATALIQDRTGTIWFTTSQPPYLQKIQGGTAVAATGPLPEGIQTVFEDRRGRMLLGCNGGLYGLQGKTWTPLPQSFRQTIMAIAEDGTGNLWVADDGGSVHQLSSSGTKSFGKSEGLSGHQIERLYVTHEGDVWVPTHDGVYRIQNGQVVEFHLGEGSAWRYVRHVSEDADGTLWIGSRGGLTRIKGGQLRSFGAADGLPDPITHSVVDDLSGRLWVGCSKGIYRVAKADFDHIVAGQSKSVEAVLYERGDGILMGQAWGNSALRARDGSLWFLTRRGVVSIPAARLKTRNAPPPVFIESAVLNGKVYETRDLTEVAPGEGRLEFRFTALSFDAPHRMLFRYRLEGLDPIWREVQGPHEAIYTNVNSGRYLFRVMARNAEGVWNLKGASLAFLIQPHWYETWWWYSLIAFGLLGLTWCGHYWRVRSLRSHERELAQRVKERTLELQREVAERAAAEEAVRSLAGGLEERIKERTAELEAAKEHLEQDIDVRRQTEEALSAEKERLAVTLRSIGDGVIATDVHGHIILMNRVAEELTGWNQAEAVRHRLSEVFRLADRWTRKPFPDPVQAVIRAGIARDLPGHALLFCRDGRERLIADSAAPIFDRQSRITGAVLVFRDVTERRRIEEQLANADKLASVGILAAGIAHDFNNLLTGIFGYIDLARESCPEGGVHEKLSKALEILDRAHGLSSQLLTFTAGGAPVTSPTDVAILLHNSVRFSLAGSNVTCDVAIADSLWLCEIDAGQIGQVIDNLLINARQAMPAGGRIKVQASNVTLSDDTILPAGRYVLVCIEDRGCGIPPEHRNRIFDPFFTTKPKGSGLGLATVHSIIKRHRGHIEFDSIVGEGTIFRVYLPVATEGSLPTQARTKAPGTLAGRVLVMDDQEFVRDVACACLRSLGLRPEAVPDGHAALELFRSGLNSNDPFDLVILDLTIAGSMGGVETLSKLQQLQPSIKAVATSGYSSDPVMAAPMDFGFKGALAKPYTIEAMARIISQSLGAEPGNNKARSTEP